MKVSTGKKTDKKNCDVYEKMAHKSAVAKHSHLF